MDFETYNKLRKKIKEKDFEGKNRSLDKWLYIFSFIGNIGSIFFAYFLVYPAFYDAISVHLTNNVTLGFYISIFSTIIVLIIFEFIKRILLHNLSFDLIKYKWNIKTSIITWLIFSLAIIGTSFYFSLNGARHFASTANKTETVIEKSSNNIIDSLKLEYDKKQNVYFDNIKLLRETNSVLREKLLETNQYQIKTRSEYQSNIDKNLNEINQNEKSINDLKIELNNIISNINTKNDIIKEKANKKDTSNIFLFILISTTIEFLIIIGIYFREFYNYTLFFINESKMENLYLKRERYLTLLKYIYKDGNAKMGEKIMPVASLKELIKTKTSIPNAFKFVDEFIIDMDNINMFQIEGKRRFINITYENAVNKVNNMNQKIILENLN